MRALPSSGTKTRELERSNRLRPIAHGRGPGAVRRDPGFKALGGGGIEVNAAHCTCDVSMMVPASTKPVGPAGQPLVN
jgi:hypothetical protein